MAFDFEKALSRKIAQHTRLVERKNKRVKDGNGVFDRWEHPVLTAAHAPLFWRYDLDPRRNPLLLERLGVNCVFNAGAIEWNGKVCLMARVEGNDRKSFFAVAESDNGVDNFRFWDHPVVMPETDVPDTNVYDMRLTAHARDVIRNTTREVFGADAVLYVVIEDWGQKYVVLSSNTVVSARARLVDTATGTEIWHGRADFTESSGGGGGGGLESLIVMAISAAIEQIVDTTADATHDVARRANFLMVYDEQKGFLPGPRRPQTEAGDSR